MDKQDRMALTVDTLIQLARAGKDGFNAEYDHKIFGKGTLKVTLELEEDE